MEPNDITALNQGKSNPWLFSRAMGFCSCRTLARYLRERDSVALQRVAQPLLQGPSIWMIHQKRGLGVQGAGMSVEEAGVMC